jgi:hypothetical protein
MTRTLAVACVIALGVDEPAWSQGLADAARKAQAQSDATGKPSPTLSISAADGDLQEVPLTHAIVEQYAQTRLSVGRAFARDVALQNRVAERVRKVKRARHAAEIYAIEPALKKAIEFNGFTVEGFLDVVLTMQRANIRAHAAKLPVLTEVQTANTTFMRENVVALRVLEHELGAKNAWLLPVPSYYVRY